MNKASWEAIKEVARMAVLAGISAAIGWGVTQLGSFEPSSVYVVVGLPVLRAIDKWLHENKDVKANGLVPF